jgi:hypothetical protein
MHANLTNYFAFTRAVRRRINAEFAQNATRTIVVKYDGMVPTRFFLAGKARTEAE